MVMQVSTTMVWVSYSGVKSIWVICSDVGVNSEVSVDSVVNSCVNRGVVVKSGL